MPFIEQNGLTYYVFDLLEQAGLVHGIFTRRGGVSPAPLDSLNHGVNAGDSPENLVENKRRVARALGIHAEAFVEVRQVHGSAVETVRVRPVPGRPRPDADGIVTDLGDAPLFMRFADCVPLLYYDPARRIAAVAHAGWRGTMKRVAARTVEAMQALGSKPGDLLVGIGPSICVDSYEVGNEVVDAASQVFGSEVDRVVARRSNGSFHFDLWEANRLVLAAAGVKHIEISEQCTAEQTGLWYSHRAEAGQTGRFAAVVMIPGARYG